jgi:hypothetical protein
MIEIVVTVVSGVLVYLAGLLVNEIWLSPLQQYKKIKQAISYNLTFYANMYTNVIDLADKDVVRIESYKKAGDELRRLASELRGFIQILSWFKPMMPSKKALWEASRCLIGLSNGFFCAYNTHETHQMIEDNDQNAKDICKFLNLLGYIG